MFFKTCAKCGLKYRPRKKGSRCPSCTKNIGFHKTKPRQEVPKEDPVLKVCSNCRRSQPVNASYPKMHQIRAEEISCGRMYCHLSAKDIKGTNVTLCRECGIYVHSAHDDKTYQHWQHFWPAYLWKLLSSDELSREQSIEVWKFIPSTMRMHWIPQKTLMSKNLRDIENIGGVAEYFKDATHDYLQCKKVQKELKIVEIKKMYNKHCTCDVRCPFGCTEFLYNCGSLPFYLVLRKFVNNKQIHVFNNYETSKRTSAVVDTLNAYIKSPRRDYLTYEDKVADKFVIRPAVMVKPNEGLVVLTCQGHDKGYNKYLIHPPYRPVNTHLPTPKPDQLAHAVVVPRNLKPFKAKHYSNTYQMTEMRGNYTGLDTCDVVEFGNFCYHSKMLFESECLSIIHREDIKAKWKHYYEMGLVPHTAWRAKMEVAEILKTKCAQAAIECVKGSSFMRIDDCIGIHKSMQMQLQSLGEMETDDGKYEWINYQPLWPCTLACPVNFDRSCDFTKFSMPDLEDKDCDNSVLWTLCAISISSNAIWMNITANISTERDWKGWFLVYVARYCLNFYKSQGAHESQQKIPFAKNREVWEIRQMIFHQSGCREEDKLETIGRSFAGTPGFCCITLSDVVSTSLLVESDCRGILVINDITRRSDIDANECLKDMLSWCDYNHEVTCVKLTCVVNYSKIYVGKHQWSAEANIYDKHSSHWMKYTRKGALGDDTPELSTSSFDEYVDSNLEEWKVAVFEVIDLKEKKDLM